MRPASPRPRTAPFAASATLVLLAGCAALGGLADVALPRFSVAEGRSGELRLALPSMDRPLGGATLRVWAHVENPNPFGVTLTRLAGDLFLQQTRTAEVDLPLGLPMVAQQDTIIPVDVTISFSDLPGLADLARSLLTRSAVDYRLDGRLTVDAGVLGTPSFGPRTWLEGQVDVRR
ncbi:MAG: LEA type 2 family protein [Gemmatimonadota bacterium]